MDAPLTLAEARALLAEYRRALDARIERELAGEDRGRAREEDGDDGDL